MVSMKMDKVVLTLVIAFFGQFVAGTITDHGAMVDHLVSQHAPTAGKDDEVITEHNHRDHHHVSVHDSDKMMDSYNDHYQKKRKNDHLDSVHDSDKMDVDQKKRKDNPHDHHVDSIHKDDEQKKRQDNHHNPPVHESDKMVISYNDHDQKTLQDPNAMLQDDGQYVSIMAEYVPMLIQHTLLVNVFKVKNSQTFVSKVKNFFVDIVQFEFPFRREHYRKKMQMNTLLSIQKAFRQKRLSHRTKRLAEVIEFANSLVIDYKVEMDHEMIEGRQSPLDMELELCQNQMLASILVGIKNDFELIVGAQNFFDALNSNDSFYRETAYNGALYEIGEKVMQLHILVLYTMFYSELHGALLEKNPFLVLRMYNFEFQWLVEARKLFVARYVKMRPNCAKYNEKIHKKEHSVNKKMKKVVDEFISEEVQSHLAKCDDLMAKFTDDRQIVAQLEQFAHPPQQMEDRLGEEKPLEQIEISCFFNC